MLSITRKLVSYLLVIAMLATLMPTASAAHFSDVTSSMNEMYLDAINYVSDNGIMNGYGDGDFGPNHAVTRAEFMLILYRVSGDDGTYTDANRFSDVSSSSSYYNAIGWAVANGITSGTSTTEFSPNLTVSRQEQMSFLYRLAGIMGYDRTTDEDLTQAADYSSLAAYARVPMSWAYEYGIVARGSLTERVWPTALEDRKDTALFVARFIRNVQGVVRTRDAFSFINSSAHFKSNYNTTYLISADDWELFEQNALSQGLTSSELSDIASRKWGGSCFGMSVATVLDYIGKIDLNGNYCNNAKTIYEIPRLNDLTNTKHKIQQDAFNSSISVSAVESKINFYQNSWHIPSVNDWVDYINKHSGLTEIVSKLEHSGIGVFSYIFERSNGSGGGHAVVAYGKPIPTDYGYKIALYDNRSASEVRWLQITTTSSSWTGKVVYGSTEENITWCKFQDSFSMYNIFDIDSYDNAQPMSMSNLLESYTMLEVTATGGFTITNAEGETLVFSITESPISGTMEIEGYNFIPYGEDSPCVYLFLVAPSSSFTCVANDNSDIVSFYARTENAYDGAELMESDPSEIAITAVLPDYAVD